MKARSAIQKGKQLEDYVASEIESRGLGNARRSIGSGSGNREKADIDTDMTINGQNIGIECKNYAVPHVKDWWLQAEKLRSLGRTPIVVYKLKGESLTDSNVIINLSDFLDLCVKAQEPKAELYADNRELQYKLSRLAESAKAVLKEIRQ